MKNSRDILIELMNFSGFKRQTEFAQFLGVKNSTVSNWFHGSPFDVRLIAEKMPDVSAEFLLRGEGPVRRTLFGESYNISNNGDTAIKGIISNIDPSIIQSLDKEKERMLDEIKYLRNEIEHKKRELTSKEVKIDEKDKKIIELYEKIADLMAK